MVDDTCTFGPMKSGPGANLVHVYPSDTIKELQCFKGYHDGYNAFCQIGEKKYPNGALGDGPVPCPMPKETYSIVNGIGIVK